MRISDWSSDVCSSDLLNDVATPEGFLRNPALVHGFYNARRRNLVAAVPNAAHAALAALERQWPGDFLLVTQNVDDLHGRAGSQKLLRSEEHTSALQSLMRISYAVFSLKKKIN